MDQTVGRLQKKLDDQKKQLDALRRRAEIAEEGIQQISMAADAVLAQVAVTFGTRGEGGWTLTLPGVDVAQSAKRYEVRAWASEGGYVLTVTEKKTDR